MESSVKLSNSVSTQINKVKNLIELNSNWMTEMSQRVFCSYPPGVRDGLKGVNNIQLEKVFDERWRTWLSLFLTWNTGGPRYSQFWLFMVLKTANIKRKQPFSNQFRLKSAVLQFSASDLSANSEGNLYV